MAKKDKKPKDADVEEGEAKPSKKRALLGNILAFVLVSGIAAGAGFGVAMFMSPADSDKQVANAEAEKSAEKDEHEADDKDGDEGSDEAKAGDGDEKKGKEDKKDKNDDEEVKQAYAREIAPILTNLAAPDNVWMRLELALVAKGSAPDALFEQIHQDLFAYVKTVKLHHIEGPSGFLNFRAELNERASIRSSGVIEKVLVRTMLFE